MGGWMFLCVINLVLATPSVVRARKAARKLPIPAWVRVEAPREEPAIDAVRDGNAGRSSWTSLDDRQLERLLSQSSR